MPLRSLLPALILAAVLTSCATRISGQSGPPPPPPPGSEFTETGAVEAVSDWLGISAETGASLVERAYADNGREPVGYIYGEEASGAVTAGLRYGRGWLVLKNGVRRPVYWQGPSVGWDLGLNASKTFTLVYNLDRPERLFQRFPGVEGTAYLVGGVGVNYQRSNTITLVPMRAGVGARLGANIGYLAYSPEPRIWPF